MTKYSFSYGGAILLLCYLMAPKPAHASLICDACVDIISKTIESKLESKGFTCKDLSINFAEDCVSESGGFEDIFGDAVCAAGSLMIADVCNELDWAKKRPTVEEASKQFCNDIGFCDDDFPPLFTAASIDPYDPGSWGKTPDVLPNTVRMPKSGWASAVSYRGKQYVFTTNGENIFVATSDTPLKYDSWGKGQVRLPAQATTWSRVAPVVYNDKLYVIFSGSGGDEHIYILGTQTPMIAESWKGYPGSNNPLKISDTSTTKSAPAAVVYKDVLYVVFTGTDNHFYIIGSVNPLVDEDLVPSNWFGAASSNNPLGLPKSAITAEYAPPAAAVLNDMLYVLFTGTDNNLYIMGSNFPLYTETWVGFKPSEGNTPLGLTKNGQAALLGPQMVAYSNYLFVAYAGKDDFTSHSKQSDDPLNFASWATVSGWSNDFNMSGSPYLNVFKDAVFVTYPLIE